MAVREVLQVSASPYPRGGHLSGYLRPCGSEGPRAGDLRACRADDQPVQHQPLTAWASSAIRDARETMAAVLLIGRFFLFVATILARHHVLRLWPGAAQQEAAAIANTLRQSAATRPHNW